MNLLYKLANLLDGEFDGLMIHHRRPRAYWNLFMEYTTYSFLIPHCLVFFKPDLAPYVGKFDLCVQWTLSIFLTVSVQLIVLRNPI